MNQTVRGCMSKLPEITLIFWTMKICATTLGETAGDLLSMTLNVGYALSSLILVSVFLVRLCAQMLSKTYHPVLYWLVILSTSTAGTTMSDFIDRTLHLGYMQGSAMLVSLLLVILLAWKRATGTLNVAEVRSPKAELFYWAAFVLTRPLGATVGDVLTKPVDKGGLDLGTIGSSAVLFAVLLAFIVYAQTKQ